MTTLQTINASSSPEVQMNENVETLSAAGIFGKKQPTTTGLIWGYYGGRYNGNTVADGTVTLSDDATNYVVVAKASGVVSSSTSNTNWNNNTDYARLYQVTTASGVASAVVDSRFDTGGLLNGSGGGSSGASTTQTGEMMSGYIGTVADKDYRIVIKAAHGGTFTETTTRSESGTCTATFKINTTALGGTANSVSTTEQSQAHASANAFSAGDDIVITVSSNSSCEGMSFTMKYTRTLE